MFRTHPQESRRWTSVILWRSLGSVLNSTGTCFGRSLFQAGSWCKEVGPSSLTVLNPQSPEFLWLSRIYFSDFWYQQHDQDLPEENSPILYDDAFLYVGEGQAEQPCKHLSKSEQALKALSSFLHVLPRSSLQTGGRVPLYKGLLLNFLMTSLYFFCELFFL